MAIQWIKSKYSGVRYREHPTRKSRSGRPDRYFVIRWRVQKIRKEEALGWESKNWTAEKANALLLEIKENIRTGSGPQNLKEMREEAAEKRALAKIKKAQTDAVNILLSDFFDNYYMPNAKRTKRSWLLDEQRFNKVFRLTLGKKPIRSITKDDIQKIIDEIVESGAAPTTVKQYRGILNHTFLIASKTTINGQFIFTEQNPVSDVTIPPIRNARERFLTGNEAEILINAAKEIPCRDLHDCIILSLNTGLRLGELRRLHWPDVDITHAMLTIREEALRKPGGKVPLNNAALSIFVERKKASQNGATGLVFPPIFGNESRTNLSHAFRALVDKLELNKGIEKSDRARRIVFHSLRHTFASWLAINGEDIYRINKLMRHKSITMTMRYAHLIPDATRNAVHNLKPPKSIL